MSPNLLRVFSSSVGTKLLIGVTGLLLVAYMVLHVVGNVLILFGREIFNEYSHRLISNPLIVPIELGLLAVFLVHIYKTVRMWQLNRAARPGAVPEERARRTHEPQEPGLVHDDRVRAPPPGVCRRPREAVQVRHVLPGPRERHGQGSVPHGNRSLPQSPVGRLLRDRDAARRACTCATASRAHFSRSDSTIRATRGGSWRLASRWRSWSAAGWHSFRFGRT